MTVKHDDRIFFICCIMEWSLVKISWTTLFVWDWHKWKITMKSMSGERPPRSENWDKVALKNTYLTDKLKFHNNTCSLKRLISIKCKIRKSEINVIGSVKIWIPCYDMNTMSWTCGTIPPIIMYICLKLKKKNLRN